MIGPTNPPRPHTSERSHDFARIGWGVEQGYRARMKFRNIMIVVLLLGLVGGVVFFPSLHSATDMLAYVKHAGIWGPAVLGIIYVICCVFLIPGSIPTLASGFLFGVPIGSVAAVVGSTIGACAAFQLGRTIARTWVARVVARSRRFASVDYTLGRQGFKVVLLTRLSPISPFIVINYLLGATGVSFRDYLFGSLLGMIPGTVLFVYIGASLRSLSDVTAHSGRHSPAAPMEHALFWAGMVLTVVASVVLARIAHRALRHADSPQSS
jgi:uncharacterized membrane protein YdjX (TVP38/TMEM64 family)